VSLEARQAKVVVERKRIDLVKKEYEIIIRELVDIMSCALSGDKKLFDRVILVKAAIEESSWK